jgi:hypothetical protein
VAPATKGVVTDGKDSWVQTTINDTDPDFEVNLSNASTAVKAMPKKDVDEAWAVVVKFLTEEGIDSPLRSSAAANNPEVFNKWVADNSSRFVKGAKFVPGDPDRGNTLDSVWGIKQDKAVLGLSYDTAAAKPRIIERSITPGNISLEADGGLKFLPTASYKMGVKDSTGKAQVASDTINYNTIAIKEDGVWKIKRNQATFYPMQFLNADGTKTQVG